MRIKKPDQLHRGPLLRLCTGSAVFHMTKIPSKFDIVNKCHVGTLFHFLVGYLVWGRTSAKTCLKLLFTVCLKQTDYMLLCQNNTLQCCCGNPAKSLFLFAVTAVFIYGKTYQGFHVANAFCRSENAQRGRLWHASEQACFILKSPVMGVGNTHTVHTHTEHT